MTGLIALEYSAKDNKKVKFTQEMIAEGSSMYLKIGEVVTLYDLAVGLLLCSGNDAANAVAYAVAGGIDEFAVLMNNRAEKIGMKNTNFANPSGLDDDNHYSTPYDMALLMCEAMKNTDFAQITSMKSCTVDFVNPSDKSVTYSNHNKLLWTYDYCIGGKTGYTIASGRCLVTVAEKNGLSFVCVTVNDRQDFQDHTNLYNYGFENYTLVTFDDTEFYYNIPTENGSCGDTLVSSDDVTQIVMSCDDVDNIKRKVKLKRKLTAPVNADTRVGKIVYKLRGKVIAVHNIVTVEENSVKKNTYLENLKELLKLWVQI